MTTWFTILGMALVTYLTRLSVIALLRDARLPHGVQRALRFVPLTVLSAIIFPELLILNGTFSLSPGNERLLAGVAAALVAYVSKHTILSIAVGMVMLWVLQAIS